MHKRVRKEYFKGMATMLVIVLIFSAGKSYAGVSDNVGSSFNKIGTFLGFGKEANVPKGEAEYSAATVTEKINYLEKKDNRAWDGDGRIRRKCIKYAHRRVYG